MKVKDILSELNLEPISYNDGISKEISGVYVSDLLSWVMSHAYKNNIWITVQVHPNIVAVAQLLDFSCIIIPEGIEVPETTISKANEEHVVILKSQDSAYSICKTLAKMGL